MGDLAAAYLRRPSKKKKCNQYSMQYKTATENLKIVLVRRRTPESDWKI